MNVVRSYQEIDDDGFKPIEKKVKNKKKKIKWREIKKLSGYFHFGNNHHEQNYEKEKARNYVKGLL
ncbi:MAG: hypothetical protein LBK92_03800 [Endomicrobium sp.]|jgi:hypothetical protein|nr:hypothetical protein [Endomicrobium sp.]